MSKKPILDLPDGGCLNIIVVLFFLLILYKIAVWYREYSITQIMNNKELRDELNIVDRDDAEEFIDRATD
jgi:hypothetical protein